MSRPGPLGLALLAVLALLSCACSDEKEAGGGSPPAAPSSPGKPPPPAAEPQYITATHILIAFKGAPKSKATRSKAQAWDLARQLVAAAKAGQKFEDLVSTYSDDAMSISHPLGGVPGAMRFKREDKVKPFSDAAFATPVGEIAPEPVETQFGYHVIRRDK